MSCCEQERKNGFGDLTALWQSVVALVHLPQHPLITPPLQTELCEYLQVDCTPVIQAGASKTLNCHTTSFSAADCQTSGIQRFLTARVCLGQLVWAVSEEKGLAAFGTKAKRNIFFSACSSNFCFKQPLFLQVLVAELKIWSIRRQDNTIMQVLVPRETQSNLSNS